MNHHSSNCAKAPQQAIRQNKARQEALVADERSGLTPAQMVERKLITLLRNVPLPFSRRQCSTSRRSLA